MKITHICKYIDPIKGGIETVTSQFVDVIDSHFKCEQFLIVYNKKKQKASLKNSKNIFIKYSFNPIVLFSQPLSLTYLFNAISSVRKSNYIHVHLPNFFGIFILLISTNLSNKKIILHWHSDVIGKNILLKFLYPLQYIILKRSYKIIVTSPNYFNGSIYLKKFKNKCHIVPLNLNPLDDDILKDNKTLKIFSIGRHVNYKGFEILVKSISFLKNYDINLTLAGDGPQKNKIVKLVNELNLTSKINIVGKISEYEKNNYLQNSDVFVLPSISKAEAFGVVLLEAMNYNMALVTTNIEDSGMNYVNKNHITGLQFDQDSTGYNLSEKFKFLHENRLTLKKYQKNAKARLKKKFDINKLKNKIVNIYD